MNILFVDGCIRKEESRTKRLAEAFFQAVRKALPDAEIRVHDPIGMGLQPLNQSTLAQREKICDRCQWDHEMVIPARDLTEADAVVIAAPYWDLMFPAAVKIWVEHMYVRNLTFTYIDDQPVGLCRAVRTVFITTSGSPIGNHDWGSLYIQDVAGMLGLGQFEKVTAEGLDLSNADPEEILRLAEDRARLAAGRLAEQLKKAGR